MIVCTRWLRVMRTMNLIFTPQRKIHSSVPQWGTEDAELKSPLVENPELTNVLILKPGVGQNIPCMLRSQPEFSSFS